MPQGFVSSAAWVEMLSVPRLKASQCAGGLVWTVGV